MSELTAEELDQLVDAERFVAEVAARPDAAQIRPRPGAGRYLADSLRRTMPGYRDVDLARMALRMAYVPLDAPSGADEARVGVQLLQAALDLTQIEREL